MGRLTKQPVLLQLVVGWGRYSIAEQVLGDPELADERQRTRLQKAFGDALKHAVNRDFDLRVLTLVLDYGAQISEVYLPDLFETLPENDDLFDYFKEIRETREPLFSHVLCWCAASVRNYRYHARLRSQGRDERSRDQG